MLCVIWPACACAARSSASRCSRSASAMRRSASARIRCSSQLDLLDLGANPLFGCGRVVVAGRRAGRSPPEGQAAAGPERGRRRHELGRCRADRWWRHSLDPGGLLGDIADGTGAAGGTAGAAWPLACSCSRSWAARASASWRSAFAASFCARRPERPAAGGWLVTAFGALARRSSLRRFASSWRVCDARPAPRAAARVPACASPWHPAACRLALPRRQPAARSGAPRAVAWRAALRSGPGTRRVGARRRRWRASAAPLLLLGLFLAAPLGDADHQQEQQDRRDQAGDEVLDVVADEVASLVREGFCVGLGRADQGHDQRQHRQDQGGAGTHRTRSYRIRPLNSRSTSRRTSRSAISRRRSRPSLPRASASSTFARRPLK